MDERTQREVVAKYSALPPGRISYLETATVQVILQMRCGVLMLLAFWSGPALAAFKKYTHMLASTAEADTLEVLVVNTDGVPELYDVPDLKGRISGVCESLFVRAGVIRDTVVVPDEAAFGAALASLLKARNDEGGAA